MLFSIALLTYSTDIHTHSPYTAWSWKNNDDENVIMHSLQKDTIRECRAFHLVKGFFQWSCQECDRKRQLIHVSNVSPWNWVAWEAWRGRKGVALSKYNILGCVCMRFRQWRWESESKNTKKQEVSRGVSRVHCENTTSWWNHLMRCLTPTRTHTQLCVFSVIMEACFLSCWYCDLV